MEELTKKEQYLAFLAVGKKEELADLPEPFNAGEVYLYGLCKNKFGKEEVKATVKAKDNKKG